MKAYLTLENGRIFEGRAFGYSGEVVGEVVFNTGMTGYQEILTDPSYYGQIVTMTYPLIGNYGVNFEDIESGSPKVRGLIVRERSENPSNWRCELDIEKYLEQNKIMGLEGIDTRELTKVLRTEGTAKGIISLEKLTAEEVQAKLSQEDNSKAVYEVCTKEIQEIEGEGQHVAVMDFGVKSNILRSLKKRNCKVTVFPATAKAEEVLGVNPDLVFLSNGPGDPADLKDIVEEVKKLVGKAPIAGICLGHQLLGIALGGSTAKLKFGHRGCNHPVKDLERNRVYITSQNHGYYVDKLPEGMVATHKSVNDQTLEGMRHESFPIFSVQFHPEACPGPKDADHIFDDFLKLI